MPEHIKLDEDGKILGLADEVTQKGIIKDLKSALQDGDERSKKFAQKFLNKIQAYRGKTLAQYAKEICDFREEHATEFIYFVQTNHIDPLYWEGKYGFIRMMKQTNDLIRMGIYFPWKLKRDQVWTPYGKNVNLVYNISEFVGCVLFLQDALNGLLYGQEIFDGTMASHYVREIIENGGMVLNPPMLVPGAEPGNYSAYAYGSSQEAWINVTQRAFSGFLTFYGKGTGYYHLVMGIVHTGEDSYSIIMYRSLFDLVRRYNGAKKDSDKIDRKSVTTTYRILLWQRPASYSAPTEQRYLWNVLLYYIEGTARDANFADSSLGYDVKVVNSMMWQHYLNIPFARFILLFFPILILYICIYTNFICCYSYDYVNAK